MLVKVYSRFEKGRLENVQATIPKGNIECNNNQYIVSWNCSCQTYFCCFSLAIAIYRGCSFRFLWKNMNTKPPTKPFGIVAYTFSDNLSRNTASCWTSNGQEKSLRHVATVAKFLDDNKLETSLEKCIQNVLDFIDLIHYIWVGKMLTNFSGDFLELNRKWPFRKR